MTHVAAKSAAAAVLLGFVAASAHAATFCVDPAGRDGCYSRIMSAVEQAAAGDTVHARRGIYHEAVILPKALSLIGDGANATIIDALGLANGIKVDGLHAPGLSGVLIGNLTVENANFEGILAVNAIHVTIWHTVVASNDRALDIAKGNCPGLPAYETSEGEDCGEGIHLLGTTLSTIVGNLVVHNAGGILVSDDTGSAYENVLVNNNVQHNDDDCGITLASHPPAALTHAKAPLGVSRNVVSGNESFENGTKAPGGAGIGIFASVPGASNNDNIVIGNESVGNGMPGIAMHSHTPHQSLANNAIIGNFLTHNGPDTADAATPGPTGFNLLAVSPATGTRVIGNAIADESVDVAVKTPASVGVRLNDLQGTGIGVDNLGSGPVDARLNWWGCPAGPGAAGCTTLAGTAETNPPTAAIIPVR